MPEFVGPTRYRDTYPYRWPISVVVSTTGTGPHEISVTLPGDWDYFWDNITDTTNGYDIVVTEPDGHEVVTYDISGFNATTRQGTIRISGVAFSSGSTIDVAILWLYWGKTSATSLMGSPTTASPLTGTITTIGPAPGEPVVRFRQNVQLETFDKDPLEDVYFWQRYGAQLALRTHTYQGVLSGDGPEYINFAVTDDGADQASMYTVSTVKAVLDNNGDLLVGLEVYGGTNGDDYLVEQDVTTNEGRQRLLASKLTVTTRAE
jgi:hypothetical protein